ncbi:MAG: carbohydrate kinase family protein [Desulfobacterales bacterium]|nr:carbohydrate kinase family protein [Desulfobacterales bacterium]
MNIDVVGLGFAAMDIVLRCEELPREDGFAFVQEENLMPGGSCANALVTLANLGTFTALMAKMGYDHYGQAFVKDLKASGVSTRYLQFKENGTSLHNFITVTKTGSKAIFSHLGDSLLDLSEEDVDPNILTGVKVFYTELVPGNASLKLARFCKEEHIPIVFNLQVGPAFMELCHVSRAQLDEMLSLCDLFLGYEEGILELAETKDSMVAISSLYEKYRPEMGLIVTLGQRGSVWHNSKKTISVPAYGIEAVDTTGAGDAFSGGLIHSYFIKENELEAAIRFASACAAIKCTQHGPRLKASEEDILDFIRLHDTDQ